VGVFLLLESSMLHRLGDPCLRVVFSAEDPEGIRLNRVLLLRRRVPLHGRGLGDAVAIVLEVGPGKVGFLVC